MRAVVQRVSRAAVSVEGERIAQIGAGLLVLLGVGEGDDAEDARYVAGKLAGLRVFDDQAGRLNLSVHDVDGQVLLVPQFTLYGDCRKGRRPSFSHAAEPDRAERLYKAVAERLRESSIRVQTGRFRAEMAVSLLNEGPVTLLLDSERAF